MHPAAGAGLAAAAALLPVALRLCTSARGARGERRGEEGVVPTSAVHAPQKMRGLLTYAFKEKQAEADISQINRLIIKGDSERPMVVVREALARLQGGMVTLEQPPIRESASNGRVR